MANDNEIVPPVEAEVTDALTTPATQTISDTTNLNANQASVANTTSEQAAKDATETIADKLAAEQTSALTSVPKVTETTPKETTATSSALTAEIPKATVIPTAKAPTVKEEEPKTLDSFEPTPESETQQAANAIFEKQRERYIADNLILQQSGIDSVKQKLEQSGYNDAGSQNAIIALMKANQDASMSSGINDLMVRQLDTNFAIAQDEQAKVDAMDAETRQANISAMASMNGEPENQIEWALNQHELDPEDPFWAQFADTEFQRLYIKMNTDEAIALKAEMKALGDTYIADNSDIMFDEAAKAAGFKDFFSTALGSNESLQYDSKNWADAAGLVDVNKYLVKIGEDPVNDLSEITDYKVLNEAYGYQMYEKAIARQMTVNLSDPINVNKVFKDMGMDGVVDEKEMSLIRDYADVFSIVMQDNPLSLFGVSGNVDDFDFITTDWFGDKYEGGYSKAGMNTSANNGDVNSVVNMRLDSLWMAYMKNRDPDQKSYSRSEFGELATAVGEDGEPINDLSKYVFHNDLSTFSDGQANDIIRAGLDSGSFLDPQVTNLTGEFADVMKSGDNNAIAEKIIDSTSLSLEKLMETDFGKTKVEELVADGKIPEMGSLSNNFDFSQMVVQDADGKFVVSPVFYYNGNLYKSDYEIHDSKYTNFNRIGSEDGDDDVKAKNLNVDSTLAALDKLSKMSKAEAEAEIAKYGGFEEFNKANWSDIRSGMPLYFK